MIKGFTPRLYQETIFSTAIRKNTLVVLPTGMGKTNIFLMIAAHRIKQYPESKILLLGPTRPLIDQYYETFKKYFVIDEEDMCILTGFVKPEKRVELWKNSKIIFSTPQGLENDIISKRINLEEVSLLGVDEAHRAVKDYAYVFVAKQYHKDAKYPRIIGLTASPGSDIGTIKDVIKNLYTESIEFRTDEDPDVKPYIQEVSIDFIKVNLTPELNEIRTYLDNCFNEKIKGMNAKRYPYLNLHSKKDLIQLQGMLQGEIARGRKDFSVWKTISLIAEAIKVRHASELIQTQGITALNNYMKKLMDDAATTKTKAVKNLTSDLNFKSAFVLMKKLFEQDIEHPKLNKLKEIILEEIRKNQDVKIIVFNHYRDNVKKVNEELNNIPGVESKMFVGQTMKSGTGLTQKEQKSVLDDFREGKFNTLISTSIGEEGLDVPKVDLVIFYEPTPSAIRQIQRRGRTGRQEKGRVIVLETRDTQDEGYRWSAQSKERRMYRVLHSLKNNMTGIGTEKQPTLKEYTKKSNPVKIFADSREKGNSAISNLMELGANIELQQLAVGDFVCSDRVCVEIKKVDDFVNSILDGRMLSQLRDMKTNFERPIVIIEGEEDIYSVRKVHPNSIRGMMATITVSYGIPLMRTKDAEETAGIIMAIAKREQLEIGDGFTPHSNKKIADLKEMQEYVVSSLPFIGPTLARPLLKKFGSVKNIVNAKKDELKEVEKIGDKKSDEIRRVLDSDYEN